MKKRSKTESKVKMTIQNDTPHPRETIGMDIGDRYSHFCAMDESGEIVAQGRVPTPKQAIQRYFSSVSP